MTRFVFLAAVCIIFCGATPQPETQNAMSLKQKIATVETIVDESAACFAKELAKDRRAREIAFDDTSRDETAVPACGVPLGRSTAPPGQSGPNEFGDKIVEALPLCVKQMRDIVSTCDYYFGEGVGEKYLRGPYMDRLPGRIIRKMRGAAAHP